MALTKVTTGGIKDGTITNEDISTTTSISQDKLAAKPGASSTAHGLMQSSDKIKLDGIADNANNYSHPSAHTIAEVTGLQGLLDGKTTETYVNTKVADLVDSSPVTLDTLAELAGALGDDPNFATTVTNSIGTKLPLAGGTMTGTIAGFTSTGIDDNATSTAITIDSSENVHFKGTSPQVFVGTNTVSTGSCAIEVGNGRIGDGYAYLDLVGDTTYNDYGLRLIRNNTGANASSDLIHRGTGTFGISTKDAAALSLKTDNVTRIQIESSGRVRIGNNATTVGEFNVGVNSTTLNNGDNRHLAIFQDSANNGLDGGVLISSFQPRLVLNDASASSAWTDIRQDSTRLVFGSGSNTDRFSRTSDNLMTLTSDGKLGIGTPNPSYDLDISKSVDSGSVVARVTNTSSTGVTQGIVQIGAATSYVNLTVNGSGDYISLAGSNVNTIYSSFDTHIFRSSASAEAMRIDSAGNVGIGTNAPTKQLDIFNNSQSWNQRASIGLATESKGTYNAELYYHRGTSDDSDRGLKFRVHDTLCQTLDSSGRTRTHGDLVSLGQGGHITCTGFDLDGTRNLYLPTFYGEGVINRTFRHAFNISTDTFSIQVRGGGGNTVFTSNFTIMNQHWQDISISSSTLYYSDVTIKVTFDGNNNCSVWFAGNTYNNNVYSLQYTIKTEAPCTIDMAPTSAWTNFHAIHLASGGEQFSNWSTSATGAGATTI